MASLNKVQVIGNLGRDPETRFLPSGQAVTNISVGTTEHWKDKVSGEQKEQTEWHRIVFFGKLAETAGEYLKKGGMVYVEGKLKTRKWKDTNTGLDRYSTEIIADDMQMLGSKKRDGEPEQQRSEPSSKPAAAAKPAKKFDDHDDDIPF